MTFADMLTSHRDLADRRSLSLEKLEDARTEFAKANGILAAADLCVFAAGSLGRLDCGKKSDLDVFATRDGDSPVSRLQEIEVLSSILSANKSLHYQDPSNDGEFLKIFDVRRNERHVGGPADDVENWFTTRMLLLLESNWLANEPAYARHKKFIVDFYFRDAAEHQPFRPLFLLNDMLRFWRTLCLNYEQARTVPNRPWKKRNLNLRFSRMLTVFGTVLPLVLMKKPSAEQLIQLTTLSPLQRLAQGLDQLELGGDKTMVIGFGQLLDDYEGFLKIKESQDFDSLSDATRTELQQKATYFSEFLYAAVTHRSVPEDFRRYLVI